MSGFHGISKATLFIVSENTVYAGNLRHGFTPRVFHSIAKRGKDAARDASFCPTASSKDSGFSSVQG